MSAQTKSSRARPPEAAPLQAGRGHRATRHLGSGVVEVRPPQSAGEVTGSLDLGKTLFYNRDYWVLPLPRK